MELWKISEILMRLWKQNEFLITEKILCAIIGIRESSIVVKGEKLPQSPQASGSHRENEKNV